MVERLFLKIRTSTSTKGKTRKLVHVADFVGEFLYLMALILARRFPHLARNPQKHSKIKPTSQSITQRHGRGKLLAQKKSRTRRDLVAYWRLLAGVAANGLHPHHIPQSRSPQCQAGPGSAEIRRPRMQRCHTVNDGGRQSTSAGAH